MGKWLWLMFVLGILGVAAVLALVSIYPELEPGTEAERTIGQTLISTFLALSILMFIGAGYGLTHLSPQGDEDASRQPYLKE